MAGNEAGSSGEPLITREQAEEFIRKVRPGSVDASLEALFEGDPEFTGELIGAFYDLTNAYFKMVRAYSEFLEGLEPEERLELTRGVLGKVDGEAIGNAANSVSRVLIKLKDEAPDIAEELYPAIESAIQTTDFGKLRVGVTAYIDVVTDLAAKFLEMTSEDPVVIANLIGIVPPLLNNMIKLLSHTLSKVDLPAEVLASAAFNVLLALDTEELGRAVTSASRLANQLHRGNLVLGRDEPRFRAVFAEVTERILANVDTREMAMAVVALGEDAEVVLDSMTDILHRDPELLQLAGSTLGSLLNVALRGLSNFMLEFSQLPDEILFEMGEDIRQNLEVAEITRIINLTLMLRNRFLEVNPALYRDIASSVIPAIDTEQMAELFGNVSSMVAEVVRADPGLKAKLEPEEIGRRMNEALVRFNRYMSGRPGAARAFLSRVFSQIESKELETAARNTTGAFAEALFENAERAMALLRPVAANLWSALRSIGGYLLKKVTG